MLNAIEPRATIAVKDLDAARRFYEGKLGLVPSPGRQEPTTVTYKCGGFFLFVYQSANAGTNQATAATWMAGQELDAIVEQLAAKGVAFESYDMPGGRKEGHVHIAGGVRIAWFKDPDGNIHAVVG